MYKLFFILPIIFAIQTPYSFIHRGELDDALNNCLKSDNTFKTCIDKNDVHISYWDVSNIRNIADLFENPDLKHFSVDISRWDISNSDLRIAKHNKIF